MTEVLGRYHLVEPLGGGPTGEVFRAKVYGLAGFERQFAVKRFHAALVQDPAASEILAVSARAYGGLSHPRIAAMHELGGAFMAVELVEGLDVARLLAGTSGAGDPMPLGARLAILAQVARVLAYAHGRGVPHLGICPTNALVTPEGDVKVCDFGILRARLRGRPADDATLSTRLPYLAPEQAAGAPGTPMTDVFALATLGYELVTGERAFAGKTGAEIAARVAVGAPRPPDVPDPVAEVFRRAFLVRAEDRFPDAGAFADALDGSLRRASLPGGRADVAAAVRRALARAAEIQSQGISGAVSFPLPAPPASIPGTPLTDVFPDGQVPTVPVQKTLLGVPPPPLPPVAAPPPPPPPPP
ncbi:MAG TPA: serine/threonine-protein kinase, partial [Haliangiales bacterium]|nr:serine/threonine-protein kinase [Haliangiales bacterium]